MPWRQAERFARWFIESIPARLQSLESYIRSTPGFEHWRADGSRQSFVELGPWVLRTLERRIPTEEDIRAMGDLAVLNPNLPERIVRGIRQQPAELQWAYVDQALARSLLVDIGTYTGESIRAQAPKCYWARCSDKNDVDYNMPLLHWPDGITGYNPFRLPAITAARIVDGHADVDGFAKAYERALVHGQREKPSYQKVPQHDGPQAKGRCPRCGFSFARVRVQDGEYCNHCGYLADGASTAV